MAPSTKNTLQQGDRSSEYFSMGRNDLKAIAQGRSKAATLAQAELDRRKHNRTVKAAQKASA